MCVYCYVMWDFNMRYVFTQTCMRLPHGGIMGASGDVIGPGISAKSRESSEDHISSYQGNISGRESGFGFVVREWIFPDSIGGMWHWECHLVNLSLRKDSHGI